MNTAVLPLASRLDSSGNAQGLSRLGSVGLLTTAIITFPACMWGAAFSEPILRVWLGQGFAHLWLWQALMFAVPMFNTVTSFGATTLLGRSHVLAKMNTLMAGQLVLQLSVGFAFLSLFGGQAFVLGQAVAFTAAFPLQMLIIARETGLTWNTFGRITAVLAWQALLLGGCFAIGLPSLIGNLAELAATAAVWFVLSCAIIWFLVLKGDERAMMLMAIRARGVRTLIKRREI
jgi:O-antigen/teichoic acid export membrane protein